MVEKAGPGRREGISTVRTCLFALVVLAVLGPTGPGRCETESSLSLVRSGAVPSLSPEQERVSGGGDAELRAFLEGALEAMGGRARLEAVRETCSVCWMVYGDPYRVQVTLRTWTREPNCFRQETAWHGVVLEAQQYDGKQWIESAGGRIRYGLRKDLDALRENLEVNRILSLVPVGRAGYPARWGGRRWRGERELREIRVRAPSGLETALFVDAGSRLVAELAYSERTVYAGTVELFPVVTRIESYRSVEGILVPDRVRILPRDGACAETGLLQYRFNVGLDPGFFGMARLRRDLEAAIGSGPPWMPEPAEGRVWRRTAARRIEEVLGRDRDCRFRDVASYGDPRIYRRRILASGLSMAVDPAYFRDPDLLAFYTEMIPGPRGFHRDCILLARPPDDPAVSAMTLLHEATHAVLRRGQEREPPAFPDDETLTYLQADLFRLGRILRSFERVALGERTGGSPRTTERRRRAVALWRAVESGWKRDLEEGRLVPEALGQFKRWCGVDFDLRRIRAHYVDLGVDPLWMPMESAEGP